MAEVGVILELKLTRKPKAKPTIIEGFPGFGLVGTIATEFLIDHLKTELIGTITFPEMMPMVAVHEGKVVQPIGIFYDEKNNLIILHVITNISGFEWQMADAVLQLAKQVGAKEIVSIEGIGAMAQDGAAGQQRAFFFSNNADARKIFEKNSIPSLKEGVVVGVTGTLLVKGDGTPMTALFAETASNMPDSKAAARIIEVLDKYLKLNVDYKPLLKQAEQFEEKIKGILSKSQEASKEQEMKKLSYLG